MKYRNRKLNLRKRLEDGQAEEVPLSWEPLTKRLSQKEMAGANLDLEGMLGLGDQSPIDVGALDVNKGSWI